MFTLQLSTESKNQSTGKIIKLTQCQSSPNNITKFKDLIIMARSKENGSLTGSKRYKEEKENNSIGAKAKKAAESAGVVLESAKDALQPVASTVSSIANATTTAVATASNTANNIRQALTPTGIGYQQLLSSSNLQQKSDIHGGLTMPEMKFDGMIPTDLLHPQNSNLPQVSEEELTTGLAVYAGAIRAQKLYQSGFKYIEEVGKTKQQYHKAEQSIIKAATESVKVDQEVVRFDKQNIELGIDKEKLTQSNERLKQSQITTVAMQNETSQLALKFEAQEQKRDAEIGSIKAQTQDIIQRYLKDSINSGQ
jgi:hypothetical protein